MSLFSKPRKYSKAKQTLCEQHSNKSNDALDAAESDTIPQPSSESNKGFKERVIGTCNSLRDLFLPGRRRRSQPARSAHDQAEHEENCKSNQFLRRGRSLCVKKRRNTIRKLSAEGRLGVTPEDIPGVSTGSNLYGSLNTRKGLLSFDDRTIDMHGAHCISEALSTPKRLPSDDEITCIDSAVEKRVTPIPSPKILPKGRPVRQAQLSPYPSPRMSLRTSVTANTASNTGKRRDSSLRGRRKALCQVQDDYIRGLMLARKNSRNLIDWGSADGDKDGITRLPERKCSSHGYYHCLHCSLWIIMQY